MSEEQALARAEALLDLRRPEQAEQVLIEHLATDPASATALRMLSVTHRQQPDRRSELPRAAERAVAAAPDSFVVWDELARAHYLAHRRAEAITAAERAAELAPEEPAVLAFLAQALAGTDDRRALAVADRAVAAGPGLAEGHRVRARILTLTGDHPAARAALTEAIRLAPGDPSVLADLGRQPTTADAEAEEVLRRGLAADPQSAELREVLDGRRDSPRVALALVVRVLLGLLVGLGCAVGLVAGVGWWPRAASAVVLVALDVAFWVQPGRWRYLRRVVRGLRLAPAALRRTTLARVLPRPGMLVVLVLGLLVPYPLALVPPL